MKKLIFSGVVCFLVFVVLSNVSAFAYISIDGELDDWGVTPGSVWNPNPGVDYIVEDWDGDPANGYLDPGWGGQGYDVEAMYFQNDMTYAYIAIVTGYDGSGRGDIAIDTDGDNVYEYGLDVFSVFSQVYSVTQWHNPGFTASTPWRIENGSLIISNPGDIEFVYSNMDPNNHYILEAKIALSLLGLNAEPGNPITPILIHWTMACGNDALNLPADVNPVPEPASLLLVAMGLFGLGGAHYKKIRKLS